MIRIENLYKSFDGIEILKNISTNFEKGKTNLIIGQSGSGKTVLLKSILGLIEAERSTLRDKNKKIKGLELTETLNNYAQTGTEYTKILNQIIKQNRLTDFEPVRLVNSVKKIELTS